VKKPKATLTPGSLTHFTSYPPARTPVAIRVELDQSSQDSFAGGISQDPEQAFLAASKQFAIPLSELEHGISSVNRAMPNRTPSGLSRRLSSPSEGRILVAATPSNSASSQSQPSQQFEESQSAFLNRYPDYTDIGVDGDGDASQQSTQASQISLGYQRYLNGQPDEEPLPDPDFQPTQPSTQPEDDFPQNSEEPGGDQISGDSNIHDNASPSIPQSRHLLSLVNPKNKWRYQQYEGQAPGHTNTGGQPLNATALGANHGNTTDEPQPSFENQLATKPIQFRTLHCTDNAGLMQETWPSMEDEKSGNHLRHRFPNTPLRRYNANDVMDETQPSLEDEESTRRPQRRFPGKSASHNNTNNMEEMQPRLEDKADNAPLPNTGNVVEETHPSFDEEESTIIRRRFPKPPGHSYPPIKPSSKSRLSDDPMDIVPDSEPLRAESEGSSTKGRESIKSPTKRVFRRVSPGFGPETNSGEIIPDSIGPDETDNEATDIDEQSAVRNDVLQDEEDEEDDIPLAAAKPSITRIAYGTSAGKRKRKGKGREHTEATHNVRIMYDIPTSTS
jgi:hypothetical protein